MWCSPYPFDVVVKLSQYENDSDDTYTNVWNGLSRMCGTSDSNMFPDCCYSPVYLGKDKDVHSVKEKNKQKHKKSKLEHKKAVEQRSPRKPILVGCR